MKSTEFNDSQKVKFRDSMGPEDSNGCRRWLKSLQPTGYGNAYFNGTIHVAHRVSYAMFNGDIPEGLFVRHTCDNRWCVSPDHLILGTNADNMQDVRERGTGKVVTGTGEEHYGARLTEAKVVELRRRIAAGELVQQIASEWGLNQSTVGRAATGRTWGHVPGALDQSILETTGARHGASRKISDILEEQERTGIKHCKTCDTSRPVSEFGRNRRMKDGLNRECKSCARDRATQHYRKKIGKEPIQGQVLLSEAQSNLRSGRPD